MQFQDRGEVEDSDEGESAFSNESQSPERARKRARTEDEGGEETTEDTGAWKVTGVGDTGYADDEDPAKSWLQPKPTTTYSIKANQPPPPGAAESPKPIETHARRVEAVRVVLPTGSYPQKSGGANGSSDSRPASDDELPDLSQSIGRRRNKRPQTPVDQVLNVASARSSPLSELDGSPLPPDVFTFGNNWEADTVIVPGPAPHPRQSDCDDDADIISQIQATDRVAALTAGRTLRIRKEKQLHPYAWEMTLYQQQLKQRGIKPVRFATADRRAPETQDRSYSGDESESQEQLDDRCRFPVRPSPELGADLPFPENPNARATDIGSSQASTASSSDDGFPDVDAVPGRNVQGITYDGRKRRKILHVQGESRPNIVTASAPTERGAAADANEYSIPPSPPSTSSDLAQHPEPQVEPTRFRTLPSGFRVPIGTTPAPLPTPQVSSEVRPARATFDSTRSMSGSPPVRSRISTLEDVRPQPIYIDPGTESDGEAAEDLSPEPDLGDRRLRRVQKRIRGVLPASWLKIDLQSRQHQAPPSPSRLRTLSTASPPPTVRPERGVAQRVTRIASTPSRTVLDLASGDGSQSDTEQHHRAGQPPSRPNLSLDKVLPFGGDVDDDRMEVDWVDPMVAGTSGPRRSVNKGKRRQPRITDAFLNAGSRGGVDLSEERLGMQYRAGTSTSKRQGPWRVTERAPPRARAHPTAPRLSLLDAPRYSNTPGAEIPQFLRVAQRQIRTRADRGRHTPSHKVIRLATSEDTKDATAVLTAWHEGTIVPRVSPDRHSSSRHVGLRAPSPAKSVGDHCNVEALTRSDRPRQPLAEIANLQQQLLPPPLREEESVGHPKHEPRVIYRRPQTRQTLLQPTVIRPIANPGELRTPGLSVHVAANSEGNAVRQQRKGNEVPPQSARYRGAQLESLERTYDTEHRAAAFERWMNCLTESIARPMHGAFRRPWQLDQFLAHQHVGSAKHPSNLGPERVLQRAVEGDEQETARPSVLARRLRKRPPQHIDTEARQYRQPSEPLPDSYMENFRSSTATDTERPALHGFGPFGTRYATDFDIQPLPLGTFFHQSTFIGSGDFAACLKLAERDFTSVTGTIRVHVAGDVLGWGPWSEEVAAGLGRISNAILDALQTLSEPHVDAPQDEQLAIVTANIDHMLRSVVRYCSKCLTFSDLVDRRSCVQHLQRLVESLLEINFDVQLGINSYRRLRTRIRRYTIVIATQTTLLSRHDVIGADAKQRSEALATCAASTLARHLFPPAFDELRLFYDDNQQSAKREAGIRDDDTSVSSIVILKYCTRALESTPAHLWRLLEEAWQPDVGNIDNILALDKVWYDLFTLLPMMEVDVTGMARPGSRLYDSTHDWSLPRALTERVLRLYPATSMTPAASLNNYVRATLMRSFWLAARWGWSKCEAILGTIFDFYAQRSLAQLDREESSGSPKFLDDLENSPSLEAQPEDRSFTIFLKLLAIGLLNMQKFSEYSDRKIGGIAWRFIPNHGRTYPKDADVKQSDMDALRNHHNLLCTLYYSSPPGHRLRVELVQHLVNHSNSHREACRLNVRAWATIISFQAATSESLDALQPLTAWFRDLLHTTMAQFRLAKTEAEHDFATARARAQVGSSITDGLLTSIVAANQRSITATLVEILAGLKRALLASKSLSTAITLAEGCAFWKAFVPCDTAEKRLVPALSEAVEVIKAALSAQCRLAITLDSQGTSEESQDYGDASALQELVASDGADSTIAHEPTVSECLHEPLSELISSLFGADVALEDPMLERVVDVWVLVARENIRGTHRTWSSLIDTYSPDSWHHLRDTEQRRKFTPYFLARVVEAASGEESDVMIGALTALLTCLVDREATLKYQHLLLAAVLNNASNEPLMSNLPFSRDKKTDVYVVSLAELRERRLALLSSILSGMRDGLEEIVRTQPQMLQLSRRRYADMLRTLMQAMKSNYQELQGTTHHEQSADPALQGSYVTFVQEVVSFLQQYTTDICRVDPFFTDSAAFPLPAADPMYVVGRLRSYVPKLGDGKIRKQLAVFVHSVSERAAMDGHQAYLVGQLRNAMDGVLERGNSSAPTMRHVLLTAVFPAYVEAALSTACSWILALPILQVSGTVVRDLLYQVDLANDASVNTVIETLLATVGSLLEPLRHSLAHPGLLGLPHVRKVLGLVFEAAGGSLTVCESMNRLGHAVPTILGAMSELNRDAEKVARRLLGTYEGAWEEAPKSSLARVESWSDTRAFARNQLLESLENDWHAYDGVYTIRRGNMSREVVVPLSDEDEEERSLLVAIRRFREGFAAIMTARQARVRRNAVGGSCVMGSLMV
ncbi:hypothetical protein LTR82_001341 [Friedmanniomyces endolithicus]|uniref:Uncharacterized protein n=1 Tax=Friedmanniomyces endolithicus TaxID=329885 RepID=A0AAN6G4X2_9PEZI|nr:hypothetical protein LTR82_001341 [Friedmanniomyces endolithicus]